MAEMPVHVLTDELCALSQRFDREDNSHAGQQAWALLRLVALEFPEAMARKVAGSIPLSPILTYRPVAQLQQIGTRHTDSLVATAQVLQALYDQGLPDFQILGACFNTALQYLWPDWPTQKLKRELRKYVIRDLAVREDVLDAVLVTRVANHLGHDTADVAPQQTADSASAGKEGAHG